MRRRCVTLFQIRIRKSYTIPCHRNNINWFFSPPCGSHFGGIWERCIWTVQKILQALRANYGWWKSGHLNVWSWEYHEQPTHNYHVWWSKQQLTPWRPTTCCCSNRKSPYPPVYSRGKILCCIVDARKYNILGTSSGRDGARSTFPLCNLDKSRCTQRGTWLLVILFWPHLSCIAITGRQVKVLIKTAVYERPVNKLCLLVENECPSTGNVDTEK